MECKKQFKRNWVICTVKQFKGLYASNCYWTEFKRIATAATMGYTRSTLSRAAAVHSDTMYPHHDSFCAESRNVSLPSQGSVKFVHARMTNAPLAPVFIQVVKSVSTRLPPPPPSTPAVYTGRRELGVSTPSRFIKKIFNIFHPVRIFIFILF